MAALKIGQSAPRFSLKDKDGYTHTLDKPKAEYTVIYFYPKDDTPGCTLEAKEFSQYSEKFAARNVRVVGVSGGDDKTKAKFCNKYSLKVPLVSDTDCKVAKSYGAYGTKQFMGRTFQGIFRKTFLVDKAGKIAHIFDTVKPEGHAQEVLAAIEALSKNGGAKATAAKATKATLKKTAAKKASGKTAIAKRGVKAKPVRKAASAKTVRKSSATRGAKRVVKKKK